MTVRILAIAFVLCIMGNAYAFNDSLPHARDSANSLSKPTEVANKVPHSTIDSNCSHLVLARYYEEKGRLEEALEAYKEALKCVKSAETTMAIAGIKRIENRPKKWYGETWESILSKIKGFVYSIIVPVLFVLCLFFLVKYVIKAWLWVTSKLGLRRSISLDIRQLVAGDSINEGFVTQRFKSLIKLAILKNKELVELKKAVSDAEATSSKPTIRSKEVSSFLEASIGLVADKYTAQLPKIYNLLVPSDYIISGFVSFVDENIENLTVTLKGKGKDKIWDETFRKEDLLKKLNAVAWEIVVYISEF